MDGNAALGPNSY